MFLLRKYLRNIAVSIDQLINTLLGGDEDETLSSRFAKGREKGLRFHTVAAIIVDFIFRFFFNETDHCEKAKEKIEKNDAIIE